jgi:hypothetical protein
MYNIMESPYEEYKFHRDKEVGSYANQLDRPALDSTVFWKFEEPWDKEPTSNGEKQNKDKNFILSLLSEKGEELAEYKSDETILGRNKDNLFVITNDVYENAKQNVLAGRKAREDERNDYNAKISLATANKQAEEVRVNNLIAVGGENYFQYINQLWNEEDPYGNGNTKLKGDEDLRLHHFKKVLEVLTKRLQVIQNNPIREGGFQYNCVSKREIIGNGFRSCKKADFAFPKEEWIYITERLGDDRDNDCHPTPMFRGKKCVIVVYKDVIKAVDKEFDCLSTFSKVASKVSNLFKSNATNLPKGGKTRCKTKGKTKGKGKSSNRIRRANKKTKNKK